MRRAAQPVDDQQLEWMLPPAAKPMPNDKAEIASAQCLWPYLLISAISLAAVPGAAANEKDASTFDKIWAYGTLYENEDNRVLQKFALSGRIQPESAWFDTNQGEFVDEFLWRRFRFGFKADVFRKWVLHLEGDFDLNESFGDWYSRLTDAYVGWSPNKNLSLKFLKQSVGFTLDGATSSKNLLTLQRNNLTNNLWFTREYFTGIGAKGTADQHWSYNVGIFSSDDHDEISRFNASYFGLLSLGYKFGETPKLDSGFVRVDYVYNREDPESGTREFSQVLSLVSKWQLRRWSIWSDLSGGKGYAGQSDVWGLVVMPSFDFSPRYQVVFRYTFVTSKDANGVRLPRYSGSIIDGRGNEYNEAYVGFNVFFHGHKLKWQTGVDYESMEDDASDAGSYNGWGLNTGIRISW